MSSRNQGAALLEILLSISISMILLLSLSTIYITQKQTYLYAQGLARIQENARIALGFIRHDVRTAGYTGCGRFNDLHLDNSIPLAQTLTGWHYDNSSSDLVMPSLTNKRLRSADVLLIQSASLEIEKINLKKIANAKQDILLINDCVNADIVQLNNLNLRHKYEEDAKVRHWQKLIYYVALTSYKNKARQKIYALYRRDLNGPANAVSEIVEGVDDMHIEYGIKNKVESLQYVTADRVTDWQAIKAVKVSLLLDSMENTLDKPHAYTYLDKKYMRSDKRLYQEWQTVINLRERN